VEANEAVEANKVVVRRWIAARNAHDVEAAAECWIEAERDWLRRAFAEYTAAFPDIHVTEETLIGEGDKVVLRARMRGTHRGPFRGIPPTGRTVESTAVDIYTLVAGQIAELVRTADTLELLQQLGVAPTPAGSPAAAGSSSA
jgi:steroid delta-isomerase-like uncharacterized protein